MPFKSETANERDQCHGFVKENQFCARDSWNTQYDKTSHVTAVIIAIYDMYICVCVCVYTRYNRVYSESHTNIIVFSGKCNNARLRECRNSLLVVTIILVVVYIIIRR